MFIRSIEGTLSAVLAACALLVIAAPARAELGAAPMQTPSGATVNSLSAAAHASSSASSSSSTATASYTVKQTTLASGTVVREYIGQDGTVFGIAWQGPAMPDLTTLLGSYFPQFASGVQAQQSQGIGSRNVANVAGSGLVVHSGGHMGFFVGQAYLPQALPTGVTSADIK